ncbi:MAG TPA: insulinase family protein, partial [Spirochaetota bacterium]|nr:insulinase family protein [Spirochaetota bacterium]
PSRYDYVFDIIANLLSDGKTSRLYKSLVLEKKIAASVNVWNGFPGARYDNLFVVAASPRAPHTVLELEKEIYLEMARLKKDLTRHELQKVINRIESSMVFDLDSNMGICNLLSYYQTIFNDWRYVTDYTRTVKSVTMEEINQAIDSFLVKDNRTVGMLEDSRNTVGN